jgi:hypothetical protein
LALHHIISGWFSIRTEDTDWKLTVTREFNLEKNAIL